MESLHQAHAGPVQFTFDVTQLSASGKATEKFVCLCTSMQALDRLYTQGKHLINIQSDTTLKIPSIL